MVVCESSINNIMGGIENTGGVTLHNHRRKLKQRFDIIKKLGQGTYGKVQLGINKETGQEVAIKTIKKCKIETEADLIRIRREIQIMSSVQHPNIIHIYEVFENREKMVLVMEYAAGGELYDYLSERKVLSEEEARRIFRQISTAVYYCHKHKICHRDLKLENILLDENGSAKIADFGLSNVFDDRRLLSTFCGSPLYASPEIVKGTPYHGPEVDCWSLGVLLYTLVYGAMPFDGSNFKRLVRQISQGDYFEPRKPSSASPLIREMLTVVPEKRANIENICAHWWVNANYDESCLEIAEDLANQTPVRLDLLLSLAPPPPQVGSDQLVIAGESSSMAQPVAEASTAPAPALTPAPARSQSVGSLMELVPSAERRIRDLIDDNKSPKRKLEVTVSTENANMSNSGAKRKEKLTKQPELCKNLTQTLLREQPAEMAADHSEEIKETDPNLQGAACSELIEESKKNEAKEKKKIVKVVKKKTEKPSDAKQTQTTSETESKTNDKENKDMNAIEQTEPEPEKKDDTKIPKRKVIVKKKSVKDKSEEKPEEPTTTTTVTKEEQAAATEATKAKNEEVAPVKPVERRRSKIFETAEKFQCLLTNNDSKTSVLEKPKKIFIPGVNVGGFKKEFERKASLTSTVAPDLKKVVPKKAVSVNKADDAKTEETTSSEKVQSPEPEPESIDVKSTSTTTQTKDVLNDDEFKKKNAVNIISNAITKDGTRKSKSRPCMMRKPPVPFGINGRSASGSIGLISGQFSPEENNVTSSAEITLKSATLPRRKTTKAEIKLDYPPPRPATMEFKTEMAHRIEGRPELKTQRSEIIVPVSNINNNRIRSISLDPEIKPKESPKERIIPISFERDDDTSETSDLQSPQAKPPMPKPFPVQRFGSLSRQSTHDSDSEATMEPIRKSPREYIIPIAVEGGGYVTPRATSLEPSDTSSGISSGRRSMPRFGRSKRVGENGSEEDLSFSSLHRHNSVGRDSDNEDSRREPFHMHRLRSSRPTRKENLEHADSLSSGEEDDDDGFEILTAENLFTTLLSRVRSLTQRINVEDNGRLGFPNSRLLGNFDHGSKLWNFHNDNLSRFTPFHRDRDRDREASSVSSSNSAAPWRRSVSRDLASDIERVFNSSPAAAATGTTTTSTSTLPRDKSKKSKSKEANKYDLNDLKLTDEDALALSYLTPGLSRRIQSQLFSQLPTLKRDRCRKVSQNSSDSLYRAKDCPFSDSSDSELFSDKYKHLTTVNNGSDDVLNEYNFPRPPPKHSYSYSYSPIAESPVMEQKFPANKVEPKIYRLEDIKKSYDKEKIEGFTKYTPYRHCYRSTSLIEPNTSNSYSNPMYFRNSNFSSENFDSNQTKPSLVAATPSAKYSSRQYKTSTSHSDETQDALASIRTVSRFGKPDYFDNCVYSKERQKREMETQKVLKEIRNKRINVNEHREKYRTRDKSNCNSRTETIENGNSKEEEQKTPPPKEKATLLTNDDAKEETNSKSIKREGRISKLIRPKSYPAENVDATTNTNEIKAPEKTIKTRLFKRNTDKSSPAKDAQNNNQFLSSIEKKLRSLYSESPPPSAEKIKTDPSSRVQSTIRSLREQSEPRNIEHCVTESGLIKRAVSSEDFSVFGTSKPNTKTPLQPSRKSVSKILGLFKKYEDKQPHGKSSKGTEESTKKKVKGTSKNRKECTCNTEIKPTESVQILKKSTSKLPVSSSSRNSSVEPETNLNPFVPKPDTDRNDLKLNLNKITSSSDLLNDNREQSLPLFSRSPCDESNDSWSVCSDLHRQDMSSPMSDNKLFSEEEANESVIDRIRRKSFYCRFNEKKKPRKTSLVENRYDYTKYDPPSNATKSRSLKDCATATDQKSYHYTAPPTKESKLCKRALSMNDNYHYHKYGGSQSNSNLSPEDMLLDAIDKNLNPKSKKSYLKTPTRFSDRITKSPPLNGNVGEGSSNNDVSSVPL